jgi:hypothetical protein
MYSFDIRKKIWNEEVLSEIASNFTLIWLSRLTPYINKHPDQVYVCQIYFVNLNLTVRIKAQCLEYIGPYLYVLSVATC